MKKIITLAVAIVSVFCLASTVFAASGINADEQAMLDKFKGVVNEWVSVHGGEADRDEYFAMAENTLTQVDLDAAACAELSATIDAVMNLINSKGWSSNRELIDNKAEILALVNGTANKYGMSVSVASDNGFANVTITTPSGQVTPGGSTRPAVNQTGTDMTVTYIVIAALLAVFAAGIVISRRRVTSK